MDASSTRIGAEKGRVNVVAIGEVRGGGGLIEADGWRDRDTKRMIGRPRRSGGGGGGGDWESVDASYGGEEWIGFGTTGASGGGGSGA